MVSTKIKLLMFYFSARYIQKQSFTGVEADVGRCFLKYICVLKYLAIFIVKRLCSSFFLIIDSNTGVLLWILLNIAEYSKNFKNSFLYRTPPWLLLGHGKHCEISKNQSFCYIFINFLLIILNISGYLYLSNINVLSTSNP